jgi:WD40 repeat protein
MNRAGPKIRFVSRAGFSAAIAFLPSLIIFAQSPSFSDSGSLPTGAAPELFQEMAIFDSIDSSKEVKGAAALQIAEYLGAKACRGPGDFFTSIQYFLAAAQLGQKDALKSLVRTIQSKQGADRMTAVIDLYDYQDWSGAKTAMMADDAMKLKIVQANVGREEGKLTGHRDRITGVAFSPDRKMLASSSWDQTVKLWSLSNFTCQTTLQGHGNRVVSVVFSSDKQSVVSMAADSIIKLWKVADGHCLQTLNASESPPNCMALSPDGSLLATGSADDTVTIRGIGDSSRKDSLVGHSGGVNALAFGPDGKTLASGSSDNTVRLWDAAIDQCDNVLTGHNTAVMGLAYNPDGKILASYSSDGMIRFHPTGQAMVPGGKIQGIDWTAKGLVAISKSDDGSIQLWQVADKTCQSILKADLKGVLSASVSPDGQTLALALSDNTIRLWTLTGCFATPEGSNTPVTSR